MVVYERTSEDRFVVAFSALLGFYYEPILKSPWVSYAIITNERLLLLYLHANTPNSNRHTWDHHPRAD